MLRKGLLLLSLCFFAAACAPAKETKTGGKDNSETKKETDITGTLGTLAVTVVNADLVRQVTQVPEAAQYSVAIRGVVLGKETGITAVANGGATGCIVESTTYFAKAGDAFSLNNGVEQTGNGLTVWTMAFGTPALGYGKIMCLRRFSPVTLENVNTAFGGALVIRRL